MKIKSCFEVISKLDRRIRTTSVYWKYLITVKHPEVTKYKEEIIVTLIDPDQIRQSKRSKSIFLYYKKIRKRNMNLCAVVKHLNGEGFIITSYLTKKIIKGDLVWGK